MKIYKLKSWEELLQLDTSYHSRKLSMITNEDGIFQLAKSDHDKLQLELFNHNFNQFDHIRVNDVVIEKWMVIELEGVEYYELITQEELLGNVNIYVDKTNPNIYYHKDYEYGFDIEGLKLGILFYGKKFEEEYTHIFKHDRYIPSWVCYLSKSSSYDSVISQRDALGLIYGLACDFDNLYDETEDYSIATKEQMYRDIKNLAGLVTELVNIASRGLDLDN